MATLKCKTETVIRVDYRDLDSFIREVTGQLGYYCVAAEEWDNDSQHRFDVTGVMDNYELTSWDGFKHGTCRHNCMVGAILNGLCADKHIPAGTYLIDVSWEPI